MRNGRKWLIAAIAVCLLTGVFCCALAEAGQGTPATLQMKIEDVTGECLIYQYFRIAMLPGKDAKELYLDDPISGDTIALHTGDYESLWNWRDEDGGWVWYWNNSTNPGTYEFTARAAYWTGDTRPADESEIEWREGSISITVHKNGECGEPTFSMPESVTRGEILSLPITLGTNAEYSYGSVYAAGAPETILVNGRTDSNGTMWVPTWKLEPGNYVMKVSNYALGKTEAFKETAFSVTGQAGGWQTAEVGCYPEKPVAGGRTMLFAYIPGAQKARISIYINNKFETYNEFIGDSCTFEYSFEESGTIRLEATNEAGQLKASKEITIEAGAAAPAPVITCDDSLAEGEALAFSFAQGEGDETTDYSGLQHKVTIRKGGEIYGEQLYEITEPGSYSLSWQRLQNNGLSTGDTVQILVTAYGAGFEKTTTEKDVIIINGDRDPNFIISIDEVQEDGTINVLINSHYTLHATGIPEDAERIEYYDLYGEWRQVSAENLNRGFVTGNYHAACTNMGVTLRYRKGVKYYYSNTLYVNFISNGSLPETTIRYADGTQGTRTVNRGETITVQLTNAADFEEYDGITLYYQFTEQGNGRFVTHDRVQMDEEGKFTVPTVALPQVDGGYELLVYPNGIPGIESIIGNSLYLQTTDPTGPIFSSSRTTVYTGERYTLSGIVPGATKVRIVKNEGNSYESPYADYVLMSFEANTAGSEKYRLETQGENGEWTSVCDEITVTVNTRGDLNEMVTLNLPETVRPGEALTLALTAEDIDATDKLIARVKYVNGGTIFQTETRGAMEITIPATDPGTGSYSYYSNLDTGEIIFKENNVYQLEVEYYKNGYIAGKKTKTIFASNAQQGNWLTADGGKESLDRQYGDSITLRMRLPAEAKSLQVMEPYGGWIIAGLADNTAGSETVYTVRCNVLGECILIARYSTQENAGWDEENWKDAVYSNMIRMNITCDHTELKDAYNWQDGSTCTPDPENADQHIHSGTAHKYRDCAVCGTRLADLGTVTTTISEGHNYFEGKCTECGYDCPHGHINAPERTVRYERADETQHRRIEEREGASLYCPDCYTNINYPEESEITTEAHTDADSNDVCDICGYSISGTWEWRIADRRLIISGNGSDIPDFTSASATPWYKRRSEIKEIILEEGITGVGAYAFGGFDDDLRVSFCEEALPAMDQNSFTGSGKVICRYFTEGDSWAGTFGATSTRWVYMPVNNLGDNYGNIRYYKDDQTFGTGWVISQGNEIKATREQAEEFTFMGRAIYLYAMPEDQKDRDLYEAHWDIMRNLYFFPEGSGTCNLTIPAMTQYLCIDFNAPGWTMNVNGEAADENAFAMIQAGGGTLNVTAPKISTLYLGSHTNGGEARQGNVTINADVETLNYYNSSNFDRRFDGTATINGTIEHGYEYGTASVEIPNIPKFTGSQAILSRFSNVNQTAPIVLNSKLNVAGAETYDIYTEENCRLYYQLYSNQGGDWWRLQISPDTGDNSQPIHIEIQDYNPNFTMDDIYWGEKTGLSLNWARPGQTVVINGADGKGPGYISIMDSNAEINCPTSQLDISDWDKNSDRFKVTVNSAVQTCNIRLNAKKCDIETGKNGSIRAGNLSRPLYDTLFFESAGGSRQVMKDSQLKVLNHKQGQRIAAILPDEDTLTEAASLTDDQIAIMSVTDAGALTDEEAAALRTANITGTASACFDVSVDAYTIGNEGGAGSRIGSIAELNEPVAITVKNVTGKATSVVRLHENENGELTATALTEEPTATLTLTFESDRFSKYVMVTDGANIDTDTLTKLRLPAELTKIEANAFEGIDAEAVIIPDGCTEIGAGAFRDCKKLKYVSYKKGTMIGEGAFDGCSIVMLDER